MYNFEIDANDRIKPVKNIGNRKKKKFKKKPPLYKYGVRVPRNVDEAIQIDKDNGDSYKTDATKLEIEILLQLECVEFKEKGYHPGKGSTLFMMSSKI